MRIEGEHVYRVPPLEVPLQHQEDPGTVLGQSAVQLFIDRASALNSDFSPDADNLPAIAAICRRLDGNPLAIEFAAARAATLGVKEVASHLDDRFGLLTGGHRTALPRHQTLHAALDWSYDLLPEPEQRLLRRLAIFPAGFTLAAAIAVMGDAGGSISAITDVISNLVSKSLVGLDESGPADRWRLLETIRAYAFEKLAESGEAEQAARCHAKFFRDFVASAMSRSPPIEEMVRCGREIDNVRAALDWSFSPVGEPAIGISLTAAYAQVWIKFELMVECRERVERALAPIYSDISLSDPLRMQLHLALGGALIFTMGSVGAAETALTKALEIAESLGDLDAQVRALRTLSGLHFYRGECRAAESTAKRLSIVARRTGDPAVELTADRLQGNALQYGGSQGEARRCFERVVERYVAPEHYRHSLWFQHDDLVLAHALLARTLWLQGYVDRAAHQAKTSLEEAQATQHKISICRVLYYAVFPIAFATGDVAGAERVAAMSIQFATTSNSAYWSVMARYLEGKLLIARSNFGKGTVVLRTALDACERTGWTRSSPDVLGALAEGLSGLGQVTEAMATVDKAISTADRGGERWCVADLLRIKGELLLQEKNGRSVAAVEDCFRSALDVARQQGALFWELRSAISVARLRVSQDRHDEARQVLAPVFDQFTEGFQTADLRSARDMLDSLSADRAGHGR
jgi:predicted ATPase